MAMSPPDTRTLLRSMFDSAIAAAQPALRIPRFLPTSVNGRLVVIGAGKASAAMARAVEDHWHGPLEAIGSSPGTSEMSRLITRAG